MKAIIIRDASGGIELEFIVTDTQLEFAKKSGVDEMTYIKKYTELMWQKHKEKKSELELPEPRLTGKFSITAGKFKCTGCTGTWTDREDAKHHSCKDYQ